MKTPQWRLDYEKALDSLFKEGERLYGPSNCWTDGPGWYADYHIKSHPRFKEWSRLLDEEAKLDQKLYDAYCEKENPIKYSNPANAELCLVEATGHHMAFKIDMRILEITKSL